MSLANNKNILNVLFSYTNKFEFLWPRILNVDVLTYKSFYNVRFTNSNIKFPQNKFFSPFEILKKVLVLI